MDPSLLTGWTSLEFIENLSTIPTAFAPRKAVCLSLRWLSAHLQKEVKDAFHKKDFFFILIIGGVIWGDVQVKDTFHHRPVKTACKNLEMQLILDLLRQDSVKIPSSSRDQMMKMFYNAWEKTCSYVDNEEIFKSNMMTLPSMEVKTI